jgi:hypothetical protein
LLEVVEVAFDESGGGAWVGLDGLERRCVGYVALGEDDECACLGEG